VRTDGQLGRDRTARFRWGSAALVTVALTLIASACGNSSKPHAAQAATDREVDVNVVLTSKGCAPSPATVSAGHVNFNVSNPNAGAVSEAELRTSDLSHILGEQENLTPGLSGGFSLDVQPGSYQINCPGASQSHWAFTVTGQATRPGWQSNPQLTSAVTAYSEYVKQNAVQLLTHTERLCTAINSGSLPPAELAYSPARIYYERIEPVAEIWGSLDTEIDGRWENPVTDPAQFMGFHKIEQLLWENGTLKGAAPFCSGLVGHEKTLQNLVATAEYTPVEMAAGATDLVNEAATSKITGEEERYSDVDLPTLQANVDGAMEGFSLLKPYLANHDPTLVGLIERRYRGVEMGLARFKASPGYLDTGYVEYSEVLDGGRKSLSGAINALAEALSEVSNHVG
jgi:iron uptake system component EfeO